MMLNYKVFFIADGNATFNDDEHNATLSAMAHAFCDVIDTDTMVGMIERAGATAKTGGGDGIALASPRPDRDVLHNPQPNRMDSSMFTRRGFMARRQAPRHFPGLPATAAARRSCASA